MFPLDRFIGDLFPSMGGQTMENNGIGIGVTQ
jgi:hypothetical protein